MFANCQLMGLDLAFPDICKTPPALLPIPYPNFALGPMGIPNAWNILLMGMPAHNLLTTIVMTNGDNPGLALGLISPSVMGPSRHITCVPNVLFKCIPATRLTSMTVQNRCNTVGMRIVPSQIKVVLLGGGGGGGAAARAVRGGGAGGSAGRGAASKGAGAAKTARSAKTAGPKASSAKSGASGKGASGKGGGGKGGGKGKGKGKDDPRYRRGKFRKGVRDKVWDAEAKKSKDGVVRDPVTQKRMNKDEPWDMGHKPGYEHRKHVDSAKRRGIDRKQFLDEYNDPSHYRPELPRSNRSHQGELKTDDYFGP
ncbi:PAAR-like domain-containing protein [Orrella sp. JC864]|uniref:PAAR-like domain-containing protein n=1 Tax=Orrella sp. JC864 TaxID=3120298 RepID=UPI0012BC46E5